MELASGYSGVIINTMQRKKEGEREREREREKERERERERKREREREREKERKREVVSPCRSDRISFSTLNLKVELLTRHIS